MAKRRPRIVKAVKQDISFMEWKAVWREGRKRKRVSNHRAGSSPNLQKLPVVFLVVRAAHTKLRF